MLDEFKPKSVTPDKLDPMPTAGIFWGSGIALCVLGSVLMLVGVLKNGKAETGGRTPRVNQQIGMSQQIGMTPEQFNALRDQLVAVLVKGPEFSGSGFESGVGESPVNMRIAWDNGSKRAVGEIKFLTFNRSRGFSGIIVEDKANPGHVILSLTGDGNYGRFNLKATESGDQLVGNYVLEGNGTLTLKPTSHETAAKFNALRDELVAALLKGPQFSGSAYENGVGESPVELRIAWDNQTKQAVGEIKFLTFNKSRGLHGIIVEDKANPGQVVLSLTGDGNYGQFNIKAAPSSQQLVGNYTFNGNGTLSLDPKTTGTEPGSRFVALRNQLVAALLRGPRFSGKASENGAGESPVEFRIAWNNQTKQADGEIKFLTFNKSQRLHGIIVEDKDNPGQVVLSLTGDGNYGQFDIKAAPSGQQLVGNYTFSGDGTLVLEPGTASLPPNPTSVSRSSGDLPANSIVKQVVAPESSTAAVAPSVSSQVVPIPPPVPVPAPPSFTTVLPNTIISVKLDEKIDAAKAGPAQVFLSSLVNPIQLSDGQTIPVGTKLNLLVQNDGVKYSLLATSLLLNDKPISIRAGGIVLGDVRHGQSAIQQNGGVTTVSVGGFLHSLSVKPIVAQKGMLYSFQEQ